MLMRCVVMRAQGRKELRRVARESTPSRGSESGCNVEKEECQVCTVTFTSTDSRPSQVAPRGEGPKQKSASGGKTKKWRGI